VKKNVMGCNISFSYTNCRCATIIFYYTDLVAAKDPEEVSYVKAKYNAADVITCLNSSNCT
jgi:hypothetical protein